MNITQILNIFNIFKQKVKVLKYKLIYWEFGTHYFKPLPKIFKDRNEFLDIIQNPVKNIYCVGEVISSSLLFVRKGYI